MLAAQTWIIADGRAVSPPATVSQFPQAIGYWLVQAAFLALALGIAGLLAARRAAGVRPGAGGARRRWAVTAAALAAATAVFTPLYLLTSHLVHHHAAQGAPPALGVAGMVLCVVTFAVLGAAALRRRRAAAKARSADAGTGVAAAAARH